MWLIAETTAGNAIEWWQDGKCQLSIPVQSSDFQKLEIIIRLLKDVGASFPT
jgi:hypothetical protein